MSMPTEERQVRTVCGWIGVEIGRSRVRTQSKAGYGLYRVRGSVALPCGCHRDRVLHVWKPTEWTAYAFTLEEIETEAELAISVGIPKAPSDLWLRPAGGGSAVGVTTRWTSAYRGRRDEGVSSAVHLPGGGA